jgi:hypothetical protein
MRLRGEVGRLKGIVQKMDVAKTAGPLSGEDQIASLKQMYAARVERLKQWLEEHPSEKIPEFQSLTDSDWLGAVETLTDDATDDEYKRDMSNLRSNAENPVLSKLMMAMRKYSGDNAGQYPTDLSQLQPYLTAPIDAAILQRYEIVPTTSLVSELQPAGDWVITQIAPVNPALDMRSAFSLTDMRNVDERTSNRWTYVPNP